MKKLFLLVLILLFFVWFYMIQDQAREKRGMQPTKESAAIQPVPASPPPPPLKEEIAPPVLKPIPPPKKEEDAAVGLPEKKIDIEEVIVSIANKKTLDLLAKIIEQVQEELEREVYGEKGALSYNIVTLFHQSLVAYRRFLENPSDGPDMNMMYHKEFSGRYQFGKDSIMMGQPALGKGEGLFLVTLFHEYQHHLFHKIYGTPKDTDIVWKFYNELAAYIFETLLATYLPPDYFVIPHRGHLPVVTKRQLQQEEAREAMHRIVELLASIRNEDDTLFYTFLTPVADHYIRGEELVDAIDETFTPNAEAARDLQEITQEYWGR